MSSPANRGVGATESTRLPRWWSAALAAGVALFAIYISLVPFRFVRLPPGQSLLEALRPGFSSVSLNSGSNFVANAIMFVPIGLFGLATLVGESRRWWLWLLASAAVLVSSTALSVSIETAQAFVPGRTPSLTDVVAQSLGCVAGLAGWMVLSRPLGAFLLSLAAGRRSALQVGLVLYAAVQALLLLEPFRIIGSAGELVHRFQNGQIVLRPWLSPVLNADGMTTMLAAAMFAMPVGVLCALGGRPAGLRRTIPKAIASAAAFYLAFEVAQAFIVTRRADVVEFLANALGAIAGVLLTAIPTPVSEEAPVRPARMRRWSVVGLLLAAALYAGYNFVPFDFSFTHAMFAARAGALLDVPFKGYYVNPEFKALREIFVKLALGMPVGLLMEQGLRSQPGASRRGGVVARLLGAAVFFSFCEFGQVFLPSRFPDNTDILLATAGAWIGLRFGQSFRRGQEHV